jgi:hypothetical protein
MVAALGGMHNCYFTVWRVFHSGATPDGPVSHCYGSVSRLAFVRPPDRDIMYAIQKNARATAGESVAHVRPIPESQ